MKERFATAALVIVTVFGVLLFASRTATTQTASCLATTFYGAVEGRDLGTSCGFLGIPFAAPPTGNLRRYRGRRRR